MRVLHREINCAEAPRKPYSTTGELATSSYGSTSACEADANPRGGTFQALRMAVNHEQEELAHLLQVLPDVMAPGAGVTISFHSLEDRMVKQAMRRWESPCECPRDFPECICGKKPLGSSVHSKPITADESEREVNRRSRSAKLRVFEFREADV